MNSLFKRALEPAEQDDYVESLKTSLRYRKLLAKTLENKKETLMQKLLKEHNYEVVNWQLMDADLRGSIRTIDEIIKLLK